MFIAAKFLDLLAQPLNWVALLLLCALLVPRPRGFSDRRHSAPRGRGLVVTALILLMAIGCQTLPDALIAELESGYTEFPVDAKLGDYAGVIILGGALESGRVSSSHLQPALNAGAERMTAAVALWQRNPQLTLLFTGGEGALFGTGPSEAQRAHAFFSAMGLPDKAVRYEDQSRSTWENAVFTARLPDIASGKRWLLLTSAWHMPRALATFRKAGWNVTAYPVDFRTGGMTPLTNYSISEGAAHWDLYLHEVLGMVSYRLAGRM